MADDTIEKTMNKSTETIAVKKSLPENFISSLDKIVNDTFYKARGRDKIIKPNERGNSGGSIVIDKDINLSSNANTHLQLSASGVQASESWTTRYTTNTYDIKTKDIIVNNHKLNQKLYELADFKQVLDGYDKTPSIVGGLTMLGTVLVKAWEPNLQRYVLVRRLINIPMFSPSIGGPEVNPGIKVTPNINLIQELTEKLNTTGISSYAQLSSILEEKRKAAILTQEQETTAQNQKIIEENAQKQATNMTTLIGQDAGAGFNISPAYISTLAKSNGSALHGGGGGGFGEDVVDNASSFNDGYQWMDPTGANMDSRNQCASFASQMMKQAGIDIEIVMNGDALAGQFKQVGAYHSASSGYQPQAGDLIDWAHHVGIYAGNGQYIARNSSGGVKRGSMSGMEQYFGSLWGFGSVAELQRAKGHNV